MVFSFSLTKEGSFYYITTEMMISPNVSSQSDSEASLAQAGTYKLAAVITLAETWRRKCPRQKQKKYPVIVVVNKPTVA
jgi:hypothetical protein